MINKFLVVGLICYSTVGLGLLEIASATHLPSTQLPKKIAAQGTGEDPKDPDQQCRDCDFKNDNDLVMTSIKLASQGTGTDPSEDNIKPHDS